VTNTEDRLAQAKDDDHELPATPEACAARCDPGLTLTATSGMFEFARKLSGVLVVMLELVRSQRLFEHAGYSTMRTYVAEKLGITSRNTRKRMYSAGRAAWRIYPGLCQEVVRALEDAAGEGAPRLPHVPSQSALALLPQALERATDPTHLAGQVLSGGVSVATLEKIARPPPAKTAASNKKRSWGSNRSSALTSVRLPHELRNRLRARAKRLGIGYQTLLKRAVELGLDAAVRRSRATRPRRRRLLR
jgi:hypothetical protein